MKLGKNCDDFTEGRRKLKIQVRISPNGKAKASKQASKRRATGVQAARREYPQSTNVSSPIQAASRRRQVQREGENQKFERALHRNGYARDNFVISDDEAQNFEENNEEEDEFEHIREAGRPQRTSRRQLGPPITTDEKLGRLNQTHRMVVEDFMIHARKVSNDVSLTSKNDRTWRMYAHYHRSLSPKIFDMSHSQTPSFERWPSISQKVSSPFEVN